MLEMRFKWLEFGFKCFEYRLMGFNLHSNASNLVRVVQTKWFELAFEYFKRLSNAFKLVEFGFKCFECLSNG